MSDRKSRELPEAPAARPDAEGPGPAERLWHFLTLLSLGSLFATFGMLRLFDADPVAEPANLVLLVVQVAPLLAGLPGLLAGSARTAALLAFVAPLYLAGAVFTIADPAARLSGGAEALFSITLFLFATLYARQRGMRTEATGR